MICYSMALPRALSLGYLRSSRLDAKFESYKALSPAVYNKAAEA